MRILHLHTDHRLHFAGEHPSELPQEQNRARCSLPLRCLLGSCCRNHVVLHEEEGKPCGRVLACLKSVLFQLHQPSDQAVSQRHLLSLVFLRSHRPPSSSPSCSACHGLRELRTSSLLLVGSAEQVLEVPPPSPLPIGPHSRRDAFPAQEDTRLSAPLLPRRADVFRPRPTRHVLVPFRARDQQRRSRSRSRSSSRRVSR
mmetsp:Transcript_46094/g.144607  ORF Transcript_46094/g.144607 Transcript_46094/m.144607 type:complete len:200 (-) Transcript_46094:1956-2555(-)